MAGEIWAVGELVDGQPTRLSQELATLARGLAEASGSTAGAVVIGTGAEGGATELARFVPSVLAVEAPQVAEQPVASVVAPRLAALVKERQPSVLLIGASPDGKDTAGLLLGLLGLPVLYNASAVAWERDAPAVEMNTFGGRLTTRSTFTGSGGIVLVRPASVAAEEAASPGQVETAEVSPEAELPTVRVVERVSEAGATASIEEARVIVAGGRGVGSADGFRLVEDLAQALGGVVGATRVVVDAGWIGYGSQIGQTGKIVKPALYVAAGISGAIQHKVGVQTASTIVAINKDAEAPIVEFADLVVVGDLFEVMPKLTAAIRARER
ncbi:electron transfer flavoprotein subunit alpha/FixB family protein [soil metagenome]